MKKANSKINEFSQERDAINFLSVISEKQTCYLQDWGVRKKKEANTFQNKSSHPPSHSSLPSSSFGYSPVDDHEYNLQFNVLKTQKKQKPKGAKDLIKKKLLQAKLDAGQHAIPSNDLSKIRKSELEIYRKLENQGEFFSIAHYSLPQAIEKDAIQRDEDNKIIPYDEKARNSEHISKQLKQRHVSLPWLKPLGVKLQPQSLPRERKRKIEKDNLNEIIKSKLKRKNKYIFEKQSHESDDKLKARQKIAEQANEDNEKNEIKMLKNWLQHSKSKKKMSITALLNEHFEKKYLEKKREREKVMALKSLKAISSLAHIQYKLLA